MQAGFIGLGKMGRPMTQKLLAAGHTVHVFNRSRPAIDALAAEGAKPAAWASEVAQRAEIIMTALPTPESVQAVYGEMASQSRKGQIYIDHSTVSPGLNRWCAQLRYEYFGKTSGGHCVFLFYFWTSRRGFFLVR